MICQVEYVFQIKYIRYKYLNVIHVIVSVNLMAENVI